MSAFQAPASPIHERLGLLVMSRRPSLDGVACQGERGAREADQRDDPAGGPPGSSGRPGSHNPAARRLPAGGCDRRRRPTRIGLWMTGPSPLANSRSKPRGSRIRRMSANRIAASTPSRSAAVTVTSVARSGRLQSSRNETARPDGPVLGHVSAGLPHQPDRRDVGRFSPARFEEGGIPESVGDPGRRGVGPFISVGVFRGALRPCGRCAAIRDQSNKRPIPILLGSAWDSTAIPARPLIRPSGTFSRGRRGKESICGGRTPSPSGEGGPQGRMRG